MEKMKTHIKEHNFQGVVDGSSIYKQDNHFNEHTLFKIQSKTYDKLQKVTGIDSESQ
jgi:hypothetical protein